MSHIQRGSSAETRKGIFLKLAKRDSKLSDSKSLIRGTSRSKQLFADYPLAQTCSHSEAKGLNVQQRDKAQAQPELFVTSCCASPTWQGLGSPEQPNTLAALTSRSHTYQGWDTLRTGTSQLLATLDSWSILFPWLSWCGLFFLGYLFLLLWTLGKGANPCRVQKNKTTANKQTENTSLALLAFGTNGDCLLSSASGQAGTRLWQEASTKCQTCLSSGSRTVICYFQKTDSCLNHVTLPWNNFPWVSGLFQRALLSPVSI